ncbi:hypothetical protein GLOIN_2v1471120 [Rhizophagus clarus]|uniref:Uncharacterized protein n=1 Tax=Rhizophagus clarus TaxID=94130 RepID=A0A8H3M584_9GLOM|nr:hypothetical protein GLOIN_2v1471120 [Rhizophagus clarus]
MSICLTTSEQFEPVINKPNKPISKNTNTPPKEISVKHDSSKPINEVLSTILLSRAQREERLKKRAVKLCEDPDKFVTITEKDKHDSLTFWNRMEIDSQMCAWTIELENDSKEHMDMMVHERLIGEEIICCGLEDNGVTIS